MRLHAPGASLISHSVVNLCSFFCSLQFCIVIKLFEFASLMVQSIVCNHGRFNATPFIESFQVKCSWKLSKVTKSAQIAADELYHSQSIFGWNLNEISDTMICPLGKLYTASSCSELCASMLM